MIIGLLWIKFIIVPKRNNAFLRFNEKNYLKCQGENKVSPWLFIFLLKQESLVHPTFYDFYIQNDNTCLHPNKRVSIN